MGSFAFTSCSSDDTPEYTEEDGIEYIGEASSEWTLSQDYPSWVCENLDEFNKYKFCGEDEDDVRAYCMPSSSLWFLSFDFYSFELKSKRCLAVEYSTTPVLNNKTFQGTTYFSNDGRIIKGSAVEEAFQKEHKKILSTALDNLEEVQMEETMVNGHEISSWLNPNLKELTAASLKNQEKITYLFIRYNDILEIINIQYQYITGENILMMGSFQFNLDGIEAEVSSQEYRDAEGAWIYLKEISSSYTILQEAYR